MPRPAAKFKRINDKKETAENLEFLLAHKSMQWNYVVCSETSRKRLCCLCVCVCEGERVGRRQAVSINVGERVVVAQVLFPKRALLSVGACKYAKLGNETEAVLWLRPKQPHLSYSTHHNSISLFACGGCFYWRWHWAKLSRYSKYRVHAICYRSHILWTLFTRQLTHKVHLNILKWNYAKLSKYV